MNSKIKKKYRQRVREILVKIVNKFVLIFKYICNNILMLLFLIILLLLIYVIYTSLNKFDNIYEAEKFSSLLTNSLKDLALAFSPIVTLIMNSKIKKIEFEHDKKIKIIEQQIEEKKIWQSKLQDKFERYLIICTKYINTDEIITDSGYFEAYIELKTQIRNESLKDSLENNHYHMTHKASSNTRKAIFNTLIDKYTKLSTKD